MNVPIIKKNESHVTKGVKKILDAHHWFWWMTPANGYGASGIADFCAVKQGMFLAIETKANRNDPTPMQRAYLDSIRTCDHFAFVVRDTNLDAFEQFVVMLDKSIEYSAQGQIPPAEIGGPMLDAIKRLTDDEVVKGKRT